jgi:hypothetical protein
MISWVLSVLAAIVGIALVFVLIFMLCVGIDELRRFKVVRIIGKILVPLLGIVIVVGFVGAVSIFIHRTWVALHTT